MTCNCTTDITARLKGTEVQHRKVLAAKFLSLGLIFGENKIEAVTTSEIELRLEGRKRPYTQNILHNYCPFCGIKIQQAK